MTKNPLPNGGGTGDFHIGDVYFFMFEGLPGLIYKKQVFKIFGIRVPGYKLDSSNSITFDSPTKDDNLQINVRFFKALPNEIDVTPREDSDSE